VWGQLAPNAYSDEQLAKHLDAVRGVLEGWIHWAGLL
jgi:hypothetical protein